jgi:stage V sporulation protein SpoVS
MTKDIEIITIDLKVGGLTNPGSLKTAIVGHLKSGKKVVKLHAVGVAANYIATKSAIMARAQMQMMGQDICYYCYFKDVAIDCGGKAEIGSHKTGICWEISVI